MLLLKNLPSFIQKKFRVGSGNIIGKGVIQDFFTCAGALPSMGSPILHRTSSLADAIAMLIVELERQFMHIISIMDIQGIHTNNIAIMLIIQKFSTKHSIDFFFKHLSTIILSIILTKDIKKVKCMRQTQLTSNRFNIIGSLKEISKWMRIHKLLASEDASKKKVQANIRSNERRANKTARVKWGRGKREANGK